MVDKRLRVDRDLHQIEFELSRIYNMDGGMGNQEEKDVLVRLEDMRISLLLKKEETW